MYMGRSGKLNIRKCLLYLWSYKHSEHEGAGNVRNKYTIFLLKRNLAFYVEFFVCFCIFMKLNYVLKYLHYLLICIKCIFYVLSVYSYIVGTNFKI